MIDIKVTGVNKVVKNLRTVKGSGFKGVRSAFVEGMDNIRKGANASLIAKSHSTKWWGGGGTNINRPSESIKVNWFTNKPIIRGNTIQAALANKSPHAHMVEFGTTSPITATGGGKMYFWGGDSYGWQDHWQVKGQPGKHYLQYGVDMSKGWLKDKIAKDVKSHWVF